MSRLKILIEGIVQGVGFRPFVYQLARRMKLSGTVCNDTRGVTIEVEGQPELLQDFVASLRTEKPPLAVIHRLDVETIQPVGDTDFTILLSSIDDSRRAQVAPDTFVCADCLDELFNPSDRRYQYPFINCTNCGPRYSIVTGIPYDRALTTMVDFPLCEECRDEYEDPRSRRFHAQPNACPKCGPSLELLDSSGQVRGADDPLAATIAALKNGCIVAIKGLGGYHLAVDATNKAAVLKLRRRKQRDEKPFALMVYDLAAARDFVEIDQGESRLLSGVERPIVLLRKKVNPALVEEIAPRNRYFGVMLPYTPLHHLLLKHFSALVMTSANLSDEPIAYQDEDACSRLSKIADMFLTNNRRIHTRTDDSIVRVMAGRALTLRRSRGYAPGGVALPQEQTAVLAVGAELKNTVCLTRGDRAFLSQHIGDLKNLEVYGAFTSTVEHLKELLQVSPAVVAHDLHPNYDSTRYALEESGLPAVAVQHHHAHLASCLAEHGRQDKVIGVIFDGTGYGEDGHIWGGEFLLGNISSCERIAHLKYLPMPGGDLATREPWRMALSCLMAAEIDAIEDSIALAGIPPGEWRLVQKAVEKGINAPLTSSCGRLFDAVAALVGLRQKVSYEGQAAMELEMVADPGQVQAYPVTLDQDGSKMVFDPLPMIRELVCEQRRGIATSVLAGKFHLTLAKTIVEICRRIRAESGLNSVVLSGGVFQNCLLTEMSLKYLLEAEFEVLTHSLVPPNDGGLALGQAVVAAQQFCSG